MSRQRIVVLFAPKGEWTRRWRVAHSIAATLWTVWRGTENRQAVRATIQSGQSWRQKIQRIKAQLMVATAKEVYSERNMKRLHLCKGICVCPPGVGHKAARR